MGKNKGAWSSFTPSDWLAYYKALNKELPVDKCGFDLSDEEAEVYKRELAFLKKERASHPGVPILYELDYKDFE